jgi:hypothetical protein
MLDEVKAVQASDHPCPPLGITSRKTWRYLLSELRAYVLAQGNSEQQ